MGLFDWLGRGRRRDTAPPPVWHVSRDGERVIVEDSRGPRFEVSLREARFVRVVPLTGVVSHARAQGHGWQVTLSQPAGDMLVGPPMADWHAAWDLAQLLVARTELPLDESTEKMFSRVGQFSPEQPTA